MNIFVAKLNFDTTEQDLRDLFEEFGTVDSVKIIMNRDTHKSKGFGFVEMADEEEGAAAIEELHECEFDGRVIVVKKAEPRESYRGGNNRGGGGGFNRNRGGGGYGSRDGGGGRGRWNDRGGDRGGRGRDNNRDRRY